MVLLLLECSVKQVDIIEIMASWNTLFMAQKVLAHSFTFFEVAEVVNNGHVVTIGF